MPTSKKYYLPDLHNFYYGAGTGNLTDLVSSQDWAEAGTVALNSADGPPPELSGTSRGPCDSTTTGFARNPVATDWWDWRESGGLLDRTFFAWFRFDSFSTSQELFGMWTSTAATQAALFRYEDTFQTMVGHYVGNSSSIDSGVGGVGAVTDTGTWYFGGFSYNSTTDVLTQHINGVTSTHPGLGGWGLSTISTMRLGVTATGVSGAGLKGDIAYVNFFEYAFDEQDWLWFWNGGAGRKYPDGYTRPSGNINHHIFGAGHGR